MASAIASTSSAGLYETCRFCQRRLASSKAGKTVGKTAQNKSKPGEVGDRHTLSPIAKKYIPPTLHPSYPFVRNVVFTGADRPPIQYTSNGHIDLGGKSLYRYVRDRARDETGHSPPLRQAWKDLFAKSSSTKLQTGSIIYVDSYNSSSRTSTNRFSGMLIGVKRAGGATTFTLRNVVHKTGVEMTFILGSPMIKDIGIILRAGVSRYRTDKDGNQIFPRWPRLKAWDMEKRTEAWAERTSLAMSILAQQTKAQGKSATASQKQKGGADSLF